MAGTRFPVTANTEKSISSHKPQNREEGGGMQPHSTIGLPRGSDMKTNAKFVPNRIKNIDGIKYFTEQQIKMLRASVKELADLDQAKGRVTAVREWMVIDLITSSGMRVAETANVRCGDLKIGFSDSEVFVRCGKGSRSRHIQIPQSLKQHLALFLKWKQDQGEATENEAHLFVGQRGSWTPQAIQQVVKKHLKALGLYEPGQICACPAPFICLPCLPQKPGSARGSDSLRPCERSDHTDLHPCQQGGHSGTH